MMVAALASCHKEDAEVFIQDKVITSVAVNPVEYNVVQYSNLSYIVDDGVEIEVGQTAQAPISVFSGQKVDYSIVDKSIATVDSKGVITAVAGGETEIVASVEGKEFARAKVKCNAPSSPVTPPASTLPSINYNGSNIEVGYVYVFGGAMFRYVFSSTEITDFDNLPSDAIVIDDDDFGGYTILKGSDTHDFDLFLNPGSAIISIDLKPDSKISVNIDIDDNGWKFNCNFETTYIAKGFL